MLTQEEFLHLLQEHEGRLYRIALAITGRDADAWDALQDAVESAVRSLPELQGGAQAFPGWMRRIVVNRAINVVRLRNRLVPVDPTAAPEPDPLPPPEASIVAREISGLMEELDAGQRQVVVLRYLADLRLEEIALRLAESGTLRINLNAIGDVQGHWVVEFPVTRQALTAVSRTVPVGQPIGPTEAGLQVEEVVILPTRTEVRVIWTGRTAPWQPVPEFRDVELRVDSGQVVPFQGRMWGDGQGDPEGNGWFRWRIGFDPLPADAKAITVHLNRVDVVSPHERLALPLVEGAAVELPGLPKVTVRTVEPGRATVEWEQDFDDVLPYQNWMLVDVFGNLHAVASQGASGTPGERQTMTATITWEDLPSGNKAAGLEARWVWRTYEGDWQVEVPLE